MFSRMFRVHGQFCASRPWEVIIGTLTLTICVMSMSLFATSRKICGWNMNCEGEENDTKSSDVIILSLTRCLAVIYLYLQFRKLRRLGSKYLLGIVGVFTIIASFVFSIGIVHILGNDLTGLNEALPFFLLLVDLSKACTLARFALSSSSQDEQEVVDNIGNGMAIMGPQLTLDSLVEALVIGVGTMSGVKTLKTMCCFGCLSVIANFFAFMVFYPACLALVLQLTRASRPLLQIQQLSKLWEEEEEKPNPVTQRVKIIMCAGLTFVYANSSPNVTSDESDLSTEMTSLPHDLSKVIVPEIPLWNFYITRLTSMSLDYVVMLVLMFILGFKYVVLDHDEKISMTSNETDDKSSSSSSSSLSSSVERIIVNENMAVQQCQDEEVKQRQDMNVDEAEVEIADKEFEEEKQIDVEDAKNDYVSRFVVGDSSDEDEAPETVSIATQTDDDEFNRDDVFSRVQPIIARSLNDCISILKSEDGARCLIDDEVLMLIKSKHIPPYKLETVLDNYERGVNIRRRLISESLLDKSAINGLPYTHYEYKYVFGASCENVVGYMPIPVGVAGPLLIDGIQYVIPMATTEGCLVASTNRGCRALSSGDGVKSMVIRDGMTRAPLVRFTTAKRATEVKFWLEDKDNYDLVAESFNSTSRFARLQRIQVVQVARSLYIRFIAVTGDAMGMNMLSKGSEKALNMLQESFFHDMEIVSLSGNFCTDKKPCAVNWIEGRGKSVVAEAVVSKDIIKDVLKTSVSALVDLNINKNLVGSIVAGSIGGYNAHAANIVTAIFIATGQDPAQNVCSSNCITIMEPSGINNEDLYISCTMPSIEVGTIGGGSILPPQAACLDMLGVRGSNSDNPGLNARTLARIVCATVMAGELSLMSALAAGHLVKSHLQYNRSAVNMAPVNNERTREPGTCIKKAS